MNILACGICGGLEPYILSGLMGVITVIGSVWCIIRDKCRLCRKKVEQNRCTDDTCPLSEHDQECDLEDDCSC